MNEPTLAEVVGRLDVVDADLTIYAKRPWNGSSAVVLATEDDDGNPQDVPPGYEYFLEIDIARDVVCAWSIHRDGAAPTLRQKCAAVIHYAIEDAYLLPDE